MAWETRHGKRYYYKKVRVGGKVKSIYLGKDENAEQELARQQQTQKEDQIWQEYTNIQNAMHKMNDVRLNKERLQRSECGHWRRSRPKNSSKEPIEEAKEPSNS